MNFHSGRSAIRGGRLATQTSLTTAKSSIFAIALRPAGPKNTSADRVGLRTDRDDGGGLVFPSRADSVVASSSAAATSVPGLVSALALDANWRSLGDSFKQLLQCCKTRARARGCQIFEQPSPMHRYFLYLPGKEGSSTVKTSSSSERGRPRNDVDLLWSDDESLSVAVSWSS